MANFVKFCDETARARDCCFNDFSTNHVRSLFMQRLLFWSTGTLGQSEFVIKSFGNYYNRKDAVFTILYDNLPYCKQCFCDFIGLSARRYNRFLDLWLTSGRTIKRVPTAHASKMRGAPIKTIFNKYLEDLSKVI